jgi:3-oxoacyl-[acyl-carrier protein] reductase
MSLTLHGHVALITGGNRGIGRAIAEKLKADGADIIIHGSNPQTVEHTAAELGARGIVADLFDPESIAKIAHQAGPVDILVNNAGITRDGLFMRQTDKQWEDVMLVNVERAVQLSRALVPVMLKQGFGRIINITSIVAHMGNVGQTNYVTSKAAMTGFTKALAREVARKGVTVNAVAPGFIATEMTAEMTDAAKEAFLKQIPAQRLGEPADVAAAVAFLASPEAAYITGNTLHVNGGLYM